MCSKDREDAVICRGRFAPQTIEDYLTKGCVEHNKADEQHGLGLLAYPDRCSCPASLTATLNR